MRFSDILNNYSKKPQDDSEVVIQLAIDIIPCIRCIGNIATACNGIFVATLLSNDTMPLSEMLSQLINLPLTGYGTSNNKEKSAIALESSWVAGALLVDAGQIHESDQIFSAACLKICPSLCQILSSPSTKIDLKREVTFALWNAISIPPGIKSDQYDEKFTKKVLYSIAIYDGIIPSLCKDLLHVPDTDANLVALRLVSSMLRRLNDNVSMTPNFKRRFSEEGIVDKLEAICDRASSIFHSSETAKRSVEEAANIAADLIDDFFSEDVFSDEENNALASLDTFTFEVPPTQVKNMTISELTEGARSFGRGRGKTIPSWMKEGKT